MTKSTITDKSETSITLRKSKRFPLLKQRPGLFIWLIVAILVVFVGYTNGANKHRLLILNDGVEAIDFLSHLEQEVVIELNKARTDPAGYAVVLEEFKKYYLGRYIHIGTNTPIETKEGVAAVNEAIAFLKSTTPVPLLKVSRGISRAAQAHTKDQGPKGLMNHEGSDNSTPGERMNRFGTWENTCGENIDYGNHTAQEIVIQLIIDDGVKDRGHRKNIFNPNYRVVGLDIGPHYSFATMCVIDFAGAYIENEDD